MSRIPTEKLIQRQIHQWSRYRELLESATEPGEVERRPIITISRELGAGGRKLAAALAKRLDLQVHGISLIDQIARDTNLERQIIEHLDEQARSQVDLWVRGVLKQRIFLRDNYHVSLVKAIRALAAMGGVVILGRGANIILEDNASLRIRLTASPENRLKNVMMYEGASEEKAQQLIQEADESRREFIKKLFRVDPDDTHLYDLVINTDNLPMRRVVHIVMTALEVRGVFTR
jgi:cytidylate kinase